jgi:hypothetical protein
MMQEHSVVPAGRALEKQTSSALLVGSTSFFSTTAKAIGATKQSLQTL